MNESNNYSEDFFLLSLDMLCVLNPNQHFLKVNPRCVELVGWTENELLEKSFTAFVHPSDLKQTLEKTNSLSSGDQLTLSFESRFLCKDGSYKWLSWNCSAKEDMLYLSARDITELKQHQLEFEKLQSAGKIRFKTMPSQATMLLGNSATV
ncbi:MAG: PAS domain S-box protein [Pseudomonadota bacterium]